MSSPPAGLVALSGCAAFARDRQCHPRPRRHRHRPDCACFLESPGTPCARLDRSREFLGESFSRAFLCRPPGATRATHKHDNGGQHGGAKHEAPSARKGSKDAVDHAGEELAKAHHEGVRGNQHAADVGFGDLGNVQRRRQALQANASAENDFPGNEHGHILGREQNGRAQGEDGGGREDGAAAAQPLVDGAARGGRHEGKEDGGRHEALLLCGSQRKDPRQWEQSAPEMTPVLYPERNPADGGHANELAHAPQDLGAPFLVELELLRRRRRHVESSHQ